jgi:threonine/homoserine/homoserine lactone efflux protein
MLENILFGSGFAFAAAIQPGPLQAFLLSSVARIGWKRTLPACLAPLISDLPIAVLVLAVLTRISQVMTIALRIAGGIFLIYLAHGSYKQWRSPASAEGRSDQAVPRTLLKAVAVNILNPNPYLGWSLVLGPAVLGAFDRGPANAALLIAAFYLTLVTVLACTILLFGVASHLSPANERVLMLVSAIILAVLGIIQLAAGVSGISTSMN